MGVCRSQGPGQRRNLQGLASHQAVARPVLTGELLDLKGSELTMVATDGHRLAERKLASGADSNGIEARLIVPWTPSASSRMTSMASGTTPWHPVPEWSTRPDYCAERP